VPFPDLSKLTITELLATHSAVLDELRHRNVIRTKNNPTGDFAEWLVSTKLGLTLEANSAMGFDATDSQGLRYQIKGRRVTPENNSTQLGVIRNLDGNDFDFLVAVVFDANWQVKYAAKIPHQTVHLLATFRPHVNGHTMHLRPATFENQSIEDVSSQLA
jgi:hypothetical protein